MSAARMLRLKPVQEKLKALPVLFRSLDALWEGSPQQQPDREREKEKSERGRERVVCVVSC